jgi:hypothetical protein
MHRRVLRLALAIGSAAILTASLLVAAAAPVAAYGAANWQVAFSGTGTQPTVGGFGFWGWCDFAGGTTFDSQGHATSGTAGDCQVAEYFHAPTVSGATCELSADLTGWSIGPNGDFFFSGTDVVHPTRLTAFCEAFPGSTGSSPFSNVDSLIPAVPGHQNLNGVFPGLNELQIQVNPIP